MRMVCHPWCQEMPHVCHQKFVEEVELLHYSRRARLCRLLTTPLNRGTLLMLKETNPCHLISVKFLNNSLVIPDNRYSHYRPNPEGKEREREILEPVSDAVVSCLPLLSTSSMQLLTTTGTLVPCILTSVVSSSENTLFTSSLDGWQS